MADNSLNKSASSVVEALHALSHRRSALIKIRRQLLKSGGAFINSHKHDESPRSTASQDANEGTFQGLFAGIFDRGHTSRPRKTMDYVPSTDHHSPHTMMYQPGTGSVNPENFKF